jgi:adenosylmethionine-8-amino-7-oxononanoate aminotransferase
LQHLEHVIQFEGPNTIGAILLESVVGTAGILVPPPGYLEGLRALCDKYNIMWIADETMSGFARTGKWFAFQNWAAQPDLIVFAKGSNSGYVPVGGVVISGDIAATFDEKVFPGGLTYSGHPLAAASIVASIDAMKEEGIVENAASIGTNVLEPGLNALMEKHPVIGEVRGLGVFWALDLVKNREAKGADDTAILRVEQLYPFPHKAFAAELKKYPNATDVVWCQDEPQNQGAWFFIQHNIHENMQSGQRLGYAGRAASASPAVGYSHLHQDQQKALIEAAFSKLKGFVLSK